MMAMRPGCFGSIRRSPSRIQVRNNNKEIIMQLTVNGKQATIEGKESLTITALLDELQVKDALYVTVELNGDILDRPTFDATIVKNNDAVEFLYFMGGGR
jgi:sulfur carrier protein